MIHAVRPLVAWFGARTLPPRFSDSAKSFARSTTARFIPSTIPTGNGSCSATMKLRTPPFQENRDGEVEKVAMCYLLSRACVDQQFVDKHEAPKVPCDQIAKEYFEGEDPLARPVHPKLDVAGLIPLESNVTAALGWEGVQKRDVDGDDGEMLLFEEQPRLPDVAGAVGKVGDAIFSAQEFVATAVEGLVHHPTTTPVETEMFTVWVVESPVAAETPAPEAMQKRDGWSQIHPMPTAMSTFKTVVKAKATEECCGGPAHFTRAAAGAIPT